MGIRVFFPLRCNLNNNNNNGRKKKPSTLSLSRLVPRAFVVGQARALVAALLGRGRGGLLDRGAAEVEVAVWWCFFSFRFRGFESIGRRGRGRDRWLSHQSVLCKTANKGEQHARWLPLTDGVGPRGDGSGQEGDGEEGRDQAHSCNFAR